MAGHVYAVASGKGGVGKTTTVVNLGVMLRAADHTVALVDADLGMANLATLLALDEEPGLHDVLAGRASVEESVIEVAEGFSVLPGVRSLEGFAAADPSRLAPAVEALAQRHEYVILDTGAGLSYEGLLPLGLADDILLVTSPEPASVGDTAKTATFAELLDRNVRGVVITRGNDTTDTEAIAAELGTEVLAIIPDDPGVSESTAAGEPLESHAPESEAAAAYRHLAAVLTGDASPDDLHHSAPSVAESATGEAAADQIASPAADVDSLLEDEPSDAVGDASDGEDDRAEANPEHEPAMAEHEDAPELETDAGEEATGDRDEPAKGLLGRLAGFFK